MFEKIKDYCAARTEEFALIPEDRKAKLRELSTYLQAKYAEGKTPQAIIICTHNSRRSHLGQVWLKLAAEFYGLGEIKTYSGGTEATAFFPRAVEALREAGLEIIKAEADTSNPVYSLTWSDTQAEPYLAFSKKYDTTPNPQEDFAAIMVCNSADAACPFVPGADFRLALPFKDPKAFDDTALAEEKYAERCAQIAREMLFVTKEVSKF